MDLKAGDSTLVLGGARSGKSAFAEALVARSGLTPVYLATSDPADAAHDPEMTERIAHHRARRGDAWETVEEPLAIASAIAARTADDAVLVDCLTLWLSNLMHAERDLPAETDGLVRSLDRTSATVVLVTNEVGQGIVPENALARRFRDEAGRLNQRIAEAVPNVVLVAAGLPPPLKRDGRTVHA